MRVREDEQQGGVHVLLQGRPVQWVYASVRRPSSPCSSPSLYFLAVIQFCPMYVYEQTNFSFCSFIFEDII